LSVPPSLYKPLAINDEKEEKEEDESEEIEKSSAQGGKNNESEEEGTLVNKRKGKETKKKATKVSKKVPPRKKKKKKKTIGKTQEKNISQLLESWKSNLVSTQNKSAPEIRLVVLEDEKLQGLDNRKVCFIF